MSSSPFFPDVTSWIAHTLPARGARKAARLREPLLYLALLAALLVAVDQWIASGMADPPIPERRVVESPAPASPP